MSSAYFAKKVASGHIGVRDDGCGVHAASHCAICDQELDVGDEERKKPQANPTPPFYCHVCWRCPNCGEADTVRAVHDDEHFHADCDCGERWDSWEDFDRDLCLYWLHRVASITKTFRDRGPFISSYGR